VNEQTQALQSDIAFVKALVQEGRSGPLVGGSIIMAGGLIFGTANLAVQVALMSGLASDGRIYPIIMFGAMALFLPVLWILNRRLDAHPLAGSATNRAWGIAWAGIGWAIGVVVASLFVQALLTQQWIIMWATGPAILSLYGVGWLLGAVMTNSGWLKWVAVGCFAAALGTGVLSQAGPSAGLIYAGFLYLLAAVPGYVLMRGAAAAR
jgi:hypothetical protein